MKKLIYSILINRNKFNKNIKCSMLGVKKKFDALSRDKKLIFELFKEELCDSREIFYKNILKK